MKVNEEHSVKCDADKTTHNKRTAKVKCDILHWKQRINEQDLFETQKDAREDAREDARKEAFDNGKLKGEMKGEIGIIKMRIEYNLSEEKILQKLNHTKDEFLDIKQYFVENPNAVQEDDNESILIGEFGI